MTSIARNDVTVPPPEDDKPTLALDLDETLVHCMEPIDNPDLIFPVTFNGTLYDVYVRSAISRSFWKQSPLFTR